MVERRNSYCGGYYTVPFWHCQQTIKTRVVEDYIVRLWSAQMDGREHNEEKHINLCHSPPSPCSRGRDNNAFRPTSISDTYSSLATRNRHNRRALKFNRL